MQRLERHWPLIPFLLACSIWVPSIDYGYCEDDFSVLRWSLADMLREPLLLHGRPAWLLANVVVSAISGGPRAQHLASLGLYVLIGLLVSLVLQDMKLCGWPTLFALSGLFHPAFVWSVTWVSQRNDLLLILFLLLCLRARTDLTRLLFLFLASASKTPFVLQNLLFAHRFAARRATGYALAALLTTLLFLGLGYLGFYQFTKEQTHTLAGMDLALPWLLLIRLSKVFEGLLYVLLPLPAFALSLWHVLVIGAVMALCWAVLLVGARSGRPLGETLRGRGAEFIAIALLLALGFMFDSSLRVVAPAVVFTYLGVATLLRKGPLLLLAAGLLFGSNVAGLLLNLDRHATGCSELTGPPCRARAVPYDDWMQIRGSIKSRLLKRESDAGEAAGP